MAYTSSWGPKSQTWLSDLTLSLSYLLKWTTPTPGCWTEEPGRLHSIGLQKVRHDWTTSLSFTFLSSVQFSSVAQSCLTLCNPMNCSTPGLPVYHQLPEFTQTHVHWVSDAIQPSHPLSSPSAPAPNPSQHQSLFQWVNDLLQNGLVGSPCSPRDSEESCPTPQFKSINSSVLSFLHSPTLTSIHLLSYFWVNTYPTRTCTYFHQKDRRFNKLSSTVSKFPRTGNSRNPIDSEVGKWGYIIPQNTTQWWKQTNNICVSHRESSRHKTTSLS